MAALHHDNGAGIHPAKYVFGLARVAAAYGAHLCENSGVTAITYNTGPKSFSLQTEKGVIDVVEVLVATNGYTNNLVRGLKPKIFPVGSYCIVTEPLAPELQDELSPKGRMFYDSKRFLNYFRLTADGRMLWGGRNNLSTTLDLQESAKILRAQMVHTFPQLAKCAHHPQLDRTVGTNLRPDAPYRPCQRHSLRLWLWRAWAFYGHLFGNRNWSAAFRAKEPQPLLPKSPIKTNGSIAAGPGSSPWPPNIIDSWTGHHEL